MLIFNTGRAHASMGANVGLAIVAITAVAASSAPALAKIACTSDGYQIVQGTPLSTPYCQDNLLGKVARQYGMRVSDVEIRQNPNTKRYVCRFVGRDIRVQQTCGETNYRGRGY